VGHDVRLTRRGRLFRTVAVLVVLAAATLSLVGRIGGGTVRAESVPAAAPLATASVTVEQGDSLWVIAQRLAPERDPRDVIHEIRELNGLGGNLIQPGQVLLVPSRIAS
jgi:nucleoid-associated protein YgaU